MLIQEMTAEECFEALAAAGFGRLACARDNQPYVVPVYFVFEGSHIYSFSALGRKIEWMRANPLVCLEVDDVKSQNDWTSVVALGRYEELPDTPNYQHARLHAHELLQKRASWWQPACVAVEHRAGHQDFTPVYYRISVEQLTGHRAAPDPCETAAISATTRPDKEGGWLNRLLHLRDRKVKATHVGPRDFRNEIPGDRCPRRVTISCRSPICGSHAASAGYWRTRPP